jgi:serine/tyrosine/threonine adenylyltransferase
MTDVITNLTFDNSFVRELPADPIAEIRPHYVTEACYSRVEPTPVSRPSLIAASREAAALIGLEIADVSEPGFLASMAGNALLDGMEPYAACYGGHQFGNWAGQLGDGRAITLGEVLGAGGARWELQLKGAGPTPYSRHADGRAVMRSSVREFLCSEAMHHLGIATTRALTLVSTGDPIVRDMFYDGNARPEPGAIVCRMSPSFLRFGTFEIIAQRREDELLGRVADYAIRHHFPDIDLAADDRVVRMLEEVCRSTARMVVGWMGVGFVHGVMNTDNMSLLGLTIDYGPYGWLEGYEPGWTPNTTDAMGRRYAYGRQPEIASWNLVRLANALYPLVGEVEPLQEALAAYGETFEAEARKMTAQKLGLIQRPGRDEELVTELREVLQLIETDMTIFYRRLADVPSCEDATDDALLAPIQDAYYKPDAMEEDARQRTLAWLRHYTARVRYDQTPDDVRKTGMNAANPKYVLRNYLAQLAIDKAEKGDGSKVDELLEVLRRPFDEQPESEVFAEKRPEWARHRPGCSMLSCSS